MKRNSEIAHNWMRNIEARNASMSTIGQWLVSYGTAIAFRDDTLGIAIVSANTFSVTTARHIREAWYAAHVAGYKVIPMDCFAYGKRRPFTSPEDAAKAAAESLLDDYYTLTETFAKQRNSNHRLNTLRKAASLLDAREDLAFDYPIPKVPAKVRRTYRQMLEQLAGKLMALRLEGESLQSLRHHC